jgi:hypothetical protein
MLFRILLLYNNARYLLKLESSHENNKHPKCEKLKFLSEFLH